MTDLPFPKSLPDFQRLFPNDGACATYLDCVDGPLEAGIPLSVVFHRTTIRDHFSQQYIDHMCNNPAVEDDES